MYNCFDIADYFLSKAKEDNIGIDPMKLLKLTYISQGFNLGFYDSPLFNNQVQAWKYGTVIPDLYHVIKRFGRGYVDKSIVELYKESDVSGNQKELLDSIWKSYGKLSGLQLSDLTHQEDTPWSKHYNNFHNVVIPIEDIKKHYKELIEKRIGKKTD